MYISLGLELQDQHSRTSFLLQLSDLARTWHPGLLSVIRTFLTLPDLQRYLQSRYESKLSYHVKTTRNLYYQLQGLTLGPICSWPPHFNHHHLPHGIPLVSSAVPRLFLVNLKYPCVTRTPSFVLFPTIIYRVNTHFFYKNKVYKNH